MCKLRMIVIVFLIILGVVDCTTIKALSLLQQGTLDSTNETGCSVDVEKCGAIVIIKVKIHESSETLRFILDTGAFSCISKDLAGRLNLESSVKIVAKSAAKKTVNTNIITLKKVTVGTVSVNDLGVLEIDMTPINQYLGTTVDGIIGNNFLRKFMVEISYENSSIKLLPKSTTSAMYENMKRVVFKQNIKYGFAPYLLCNINNVKCHAVIDIGFNGFVAIPKKLASNIKFSDSFAGKGSCIETLFDSNTECKMVVLDSLRFGNIGFRGVPGIVMECSDVLIGAKLLELYNISIDYQKGCLYAEQNKTQLSSKDICNSGVVVKVNANKEKIVGGTWGVSSNLKIMPGDTIETVNGKEVDQISGIAIDSILSSCGTDIRIGIKTIEGKREEFKINPIRITELQILP